MTWRQTAESLDLIEWQVLVLRGGEIPPGTIACCWYHLEWVVGCTTLPHGRFRATTFPYCPFGRVRGESSSRETANRFFHFRRMPKMLHSTEHLGSSEARRQCMALRRSGRRRLQSRRPAENVGSPQFFIQWSRRSHSGGNGLVIHRAVAANRSQGMARRQNGWEQGATLGWPSRHARQTACDVFSSRAASKRSTENRGRRGGLALQGASSRGRVLAVGYRWWARTRLMGTGRLSVESPGGHRYEHGFLCRDRTRASEPTNDL